jgi:hypothetical protein
MPSGDQGRRSGQATDTDSVAVSPHRNEGVGSEVMDRVRQSLNKLNYYVAI